MCSNCASDLPEGAQFCLKCGQPVMGAMGAPAPNAVLACSKCGANLPDGAEFCAKCGKPISLPPKKSSMVDASGPKDVPAPSSFAKPRRHIFRWVLLTLLLVGIVWAATSDNPFAQGIQEAVGWKHDQTILETPFSVAAHNIRYYKFALPQGSMNVAIVGHFAVSGEGNRSGKSVNKSPTDQDNNIEVYVLSEPAFTVWQNGYATSSVYESGRVSEGAVDAELPAGAGIYYLVFSNKFAAKTAKNVNATVLLRYKSWLPESVRRAKDRFWNWLGL